MATRRVFVLNLDADLELGATGRYAPTRSVLAAMARARTPLVGTLVPEGAAIEDAQHAEGSFVGYEGHAFSSTPRALARLVALGASPPAAPTVDVLRAVARRDFAYAHELPDALVTDDPERAIEHLLAHVSGARPFRLKRGFGMAGRGHRVVRGAPTEADRAFVRATEPDVLIVEPDVVIVREFALHGFLRADGTYVAGAPCVQCCDAHGAWAQTLRLDAEERAGVDVAALEASLDEAARALHGAGYFGPFGVDAYAYASEDDVRLRARSEVNARYSMGWATGMGATRPDLDPR